MKLGKPLNYKTESVFETPFIVQDADGNKITLNGKFTVLRESPLRLSDELSGLSDDEQTRKLIASRVTAMEFTHGGKPVDLEGSDGKPITAEELLHNSDPLDRLLGFALNRVNFL